MQPLLIMTFFYSTSIYGSLLQARHQDTQEHSPAPDLQKLPGLWGDRCSRGDCRAQRQGHRAGGHPGGGNTRVKLQKGQHVSCGVSGGFGQGGRGKKGRPERWGWGTRVRRVSLPTCAGQLIGPQPRAPWKGVFSHPTPRPGRRSWEGFHSHLAQLWPFCPVSRSGGGH